MTAVADSVDRTRTRKRALKFTIPFWGFHVAALGVFLVGFSWFALVFSVAMYMARGFGITGFFHRKFSHHAFKTGRVVQFAGAWLGTSAAQGGPLWWVAHHRRHHRTSDDEGDLHSPRVEGLRVAHYGWLERQSADATHLSEVEDLARFPELRWLDKRPWVPIVATGVMVMAVGIAVGRLFPATGTNGPQLLMWAFVLNTVALWHVTFAVNSVCHRWGRRSHKPPADSRNNLLIGLLALGEGWHNNHHSFPGASRHGFTRWQFDFTHLVLRTMARLGLAQELRPIPARLWLGNRRSRWVM